jgi:cytidine deaminase
MKKRQQTEKQILGLLVKKAKSAARASYAPYSKFHVGAALLGDNGKIYTGANIENASYGLTLCAERAAVSQALSGGCRRFAAVAAVEKKKGVVTPCGACRQVLHEFSPEMSVAVKKKGSAVFVPLTELLPGAFSL